MEIEFGRLVNLLNALEEEPHLLDCDDDEYCLKIGDSEYLEQIVWCAEHVLINEDCTPNFELMDKLWNDHGFFVFPGERDSFGWLTGVIRTKKGLIIFG
jgi:hypothetical protein